MKSIVDKLLVEMGDRFMRLKKLGPRFGFLLDINGSVLKTDLGDFEMYTEIMDCRMTLKTRVDVKL